MQTCMGFFMKCIKNTYCLFIVFCLIAGQNNCLGQGNRVTDSLFSLLKKEADIGKKSKLYYHISQEYRNINADLALKYAQIGYKLATEAGDEIQQANFHNALGNAYYNLSMYIQAEEEFKKAYEHSLGLKDTLLQAISLNGIGLSFEVRGDYDEAIKYYIKSIKVSESIDDSIGIAYTNVNIGVIYNAMRHYQHALKYTNRGLVILRKLKDKPAIGSALGNIGTAYHNLKDYKKAEQFMLESIAILEAEGIVGELATSENSLGYLYFNMKRYDDAMKHYQLSYDLAVKSGDVSSQAIALCNIGHTYLVNGDVVKGKEYNDRAFEMAGKNGIQELLAHLYELNAEMYAGLGDHKKAFEFQRLYSKFIDSLHTIRSTSQMHEMEVRYDTEKKQQEILLLNKNHELDNEKIRRAATFRYYSIAFAIVAVFVLIFIFRAYKNKKKSNELLADRNIEIEKQRLILEVKNKEITDSITYAKRLQEAILPSTSQWTSLLPDSFIYYRPKDIVAGDFYFLESSQQHGKSELIVAAADCTGHGVPGAMVSVVCANALTRSVKEFGLNDPAEILNKTRELVIETFSKSQGIVKDGMDISVLKFQISNFEISNLIWAGANNPLWLIRNGECLEFLPDKQPVGVYHDSKSFTSHSIPCQKGDLLILFTDGFADQFGGDKGKKYKYSNFKKLLIELNQLPIEQIPVSLNKRFNDWKSELEQTDDVCVLGIRV